MKGFTQFGQAADEASAVMTALEGDFDGDGDSDIALTGGRLEYYSGRIFQARRNVWRDEFAKL